MPSINAEVMNACQRARDRVFYGATVEFEESFEHEDRYGNRVFPHMICRWLSADGQRHTVRLRPIVKQVWRDYGFPLGRKLEYVVDDEAMRKQLRNLVRSTLGGEQ